MSEVTIDTVGEAVRVVMALLDAAGRVRQAACRFCIALVLVPFAGLYAIDFWLYVLRLCYYGVRVLIYARRGGYKASAQISSDTHSTSTQEPVPRVLPGRQGAPRRRKSSSSSGVDSTTEKRLPLPLPLHQPVGETIHMLVDRVQEYLAQRHPGRPQLAARHHSSPKVDLLAT